MIIKPAFPDEKLEDLKSRIELKFILIEENREKILLILDPFYKHTSVKHQLKEKVFIGAGKLNLFDQTETEWGSFSFVKLLGYDKPNNTDEAEKILQEIKDEVQKWKDERKN